MSEKRKDNKGRILKTGESQRKDGIYQYRYTDFRGKRQTVYASTLQELRQKEKEIQKQIDDGIDYEAGQIFTGKVVSIKEFGAFVEFAPGKEGMVHISKIAKERINRVEDVLTLGDVVKVICMGKDKMGRMSFSIKDVPAEA